MHRSAKLKVRGGKLVEVKLECDSLIRSAQVVGDFFIHPEDSLRDIEGSLVGTDVNESEEGMSKRISEVVEREGITMIGVSPQAIAKAVRMAVSP